MNPMEDAFTTAGLGDAYSILKQNGIVSLQILQDFISKRRDKFEEWFAIGVQLQIERMCNQGGDTNLVVQNDNSNAPAPNSALIEGPVSISTSNGLQNIAVSSISGQSGQQNAEFLVLAVENGPIPPIRNEPTCSPAKKVYKSSKQEVVNFDLRALLESKPTGRALLTIYKHKKKFDTGQQSRLVGLIVDYFTEILPDTLLLNEDLEYIAHLIVKEFKNEIISTYYTDPIPRKISKDNKSKLSKGKLRQRFKNVWNFLLRAKKLENPSLDVSGLEILDSTDSLESDAQEAKILLKCAENEEDQDEDETLRLWDLCCSLRFQEIRDLLKRTISLILQEYPSIKYDQSLSTASIFSLMDGKTGPLHNAFWKFVVELIPSLKLNTIVIHLDFEAAAINGAAAYLENADISGCLYHYISAVNQYYENLGIESQRGQTMLEYVEALPFLPPAKIEEGFNFIRNRISSLVPVQAEASTFCNYVFRIWVAVAEIISVFKRRVKIDNSTENFYMRISGYVKRKCPFWELNGE
ncbi:hypothetical protein QAD02_000662 [Eretmocerus hayati]|uniref:Uncharacterized protein n=1 Tax=Eretmocerus hayati TaxID=131215 RepID=A0ACC2NEQ1_9HYME|nr:hypothetical protein QAD02_000662 [Eretmocerus hayati]